MPNIAVMSIYKICNLQPAGGWEDGGQGDEREKLLSKGTHAYPHQKRSGSESGLAWLELSELSPDIR